jgi:hypothetical protein
MLRILTLVAIATASLIPGSARADTLWVGSSGACSGPDVHSSLDAAVLAAAFSSGSDEIRLTETITYGPGAVPVTLTGFGPSTASGSLTLAGGYPDCFTSPTGRTAIGDHNSTTFTVDSTSGGDISVVTFRNLDIRNADTGVLVREGSQAHLENTRVGGHSVRGVLVESGAYVGIDASSIIEDSGSNPATSWGGGVRCHGSGSEVTLWGTLSGNAAEFGGNLYLAAGCFANLRGGAVIAGDGLGSTSGASKGGGIAVFNGAQLLSQGGSSRVIIRDNVATEGGGLHIEGADSLALMENTVFLRNVASFGAAIHATNGGSAPLVGMDRASACPFNYSCSEIEGQEYTDSVVHADGARVNIAQTVFETSTELSGASDTALVQVVNGGRIRLDRVGLYRNEADRVLYNNDATLEAGQITVAENGTNSGADSIAWLSEGGPGTNRLRNSILADTSGVQINNGSMAADCNLVDSAPGDLPTGSFHIDTPTFRGANDVRQESSSPGVDMCEFEAFTWSTDRDIEYESAPVNDATNRQGSPGDSNGLFDAGWDEVHLNVGDDHFWLTIERDGNGDGAVISVDPTGISCGSDCQEEFFFNTLVELHALPATGSGFAGWTNCPVPDGNICYIAMTENTTITASFETVGDALFSDRFEN